MITSPPTPANPGPIVRAGVRSVQQSVSTTPSMRGTISGWFQPLIVGIITTTIVGGLSNKVRREQKTAGIVQPMQDRELRLLPEGQRSWKWSQLHCTDNLGLKNGDNVEVAGTLYRVMGEKDWSDYGYWRYQLVEGFRGNV
jgi:hypothetical protein